MSTWVVRLLVALVLSTEVHSVRTTTEHFTDLKEIADALVLLDLGNATGQDLTDTILRIATVLVGALILIVMGWKSRGAGKTLGCACHSECGEGQYLLAGRCRACSSTVVHVGFSEQNEPKWNKCGKGDDPELKIEASINQEQLRGQHPEPNHQQLHPTVDYDEFGAEIRRHRAASPNSSDSNEGLLDLERTQERCGCLRDLEASDDRKSGFLSSSTKGGKSHSQTEGTGAGYRGISQCYSPEPAYCMYPAVTGVGAATFHSQVVVLPRIPDANFIAQQFRNNPATSNILVSKIKLTNTVGISSPAPMPRDELNRLAAVGDDWVVVFYPDSIAKVFKVDGAGWTFGTWLMMK
eukprot:c33587_g1_i1.p1 GENE.c33587_g1_i1~~c33587_g1_i1.p1  ORF type:complete len:364 (-),score=44.12 c33587_g1_i1:21-1076(-)